ncbi:Tn3 family transposase [Mesorhizobium sp. WSM2561]|uniref:Tn3 family transposase n=1 Tax=Mesorhizobium sp. WSM2561 TaxID=1040985 RepID=UPI00055FFCA9|nr:Tn3 family transposase [Mesorhizobium sp. WSM2561]
MRRNATGGLNKSESQNALVRALFFNRLGELRDRTFESPSYRPSGLKLLINAIAYWNTLYLEPAFAELNREGIATPPDVIKPITPLGCPAYQSHWRLHLDSDGPPTSGQGGEKHPLSQRDHRMF